MLQLIKDRFQRAVKVKSSPSGGVTGFAENRTLSGWAADLKAPEGYPVKVVAELKGVAVGEGLTVFKEGSGPPLYKIDLGGTFDPADLLEDRLSVYTVGDDGTKVKQKVGSILVLDLIKRAWPARV